MSVPGQSIAPSTAMDDPVRVMIVDDSAVIRGFLFRAIDPQADMKVIFSATDGQAAVDAVRRHEPDVIVLDIEMPRMDGLTAIPLLLAALPHVKIVMASTLTLKNADISLQALHAGATDYITKPSAADLGGNAEFDRLLVEKVRTLGAAAKRSRARSAPAVKSPATAHPLPARPAFTLRPFSRTSPQIVAIGSSTGGPQALFKVLQHLKGIRQPVVITQHMPPTFTTMLAEHIKRQCGVDAVEVENGMPLTGGRVFIARGDYHMTLHARPALPPQFVVNQDKQENYCRPSVDVMLRSVACMFGASALTVILTGMGQDGLLGSQAIVAAGGSIIGQDEATSVVWGMPGAVASANICSAVLPIDQIGPRIRKIVSI